MSLKNATDRLAFFTQLQLLDESGKPIRPSFYTDNFFSMLPGESKCVVIDVSMEDVPAKASLVIKGWNVEEKRHSLAVGLLFGHEREDIVCSAHLIGGVCYDGLGELDDPS